MSETTSQQLISAAGSRPVRSRPEPGSRTGLIRRYVLAATGVFFVGVGWIGAFVPGLPTIGPLLIASYCFTRSCPWLEQRLIRNRFFAPFLQYIDGDRELPARARYAAIAMMWSSILVSITALVWLDRSSWWLLVLIIASGATGTVAILVFRRRKPVLARPAGPKEIPGTTEDAQGKKIAETGLEPVTPGL